MATHVFNYCNASNGREIEVTYNDVTHSVTGVAGEPNSCPGGGLFAGTVLYTHQSGSTIYKVRVQNAYPFAYVTTESLATCDITITGVAVTKASTNLSSDGALVISATGNGLKYYSIDNGISYQTYPAFFGLSPGTYHIRVKNVHATLGTCYDTTTKIIGYDNLYVCDLALGNVITTEAPGGTIQILDYSTVHTADPVEYRIDGGAWQEENLFTGLAAGTYNVQIRFKGFTTCSNSRMVTLVACDIILEGVDITHEQSRDGNDAYINILASSSNGPIEYSIDDGGSYQSDSEFFDLEPGIYNIRVKDAADCESFATVQVFTWKAPHIEFPIANGMRVVLLSGPTVNQSAKQNFDNRLFVDMRFKDVTPCKYLQKYAVSDIVPLQFRSSYSVNIIKMYDLDGVLQDTLIPIKRTSNINVSASFAGTFSDYGGNQTQVYFPAIGMPTYLKIGRSITISGQASLNGTHEIKDIVPGTGNAEGNLVILIDKIYTSGTDPLGGTVSTIYDIDPFDVWEIAIDMSAYSAGEYYLLFEGSDSQFENYSAESEPILLLDDVSDLVELRHSNNESAFKIDYNTGIQHLIRLEGEIVWGSPGGEREDMEDSRRRLQLLRENVTRNPVFNSEAIPPWLIEKLKIAMAHDYWTLDGVEYQKADDPQIEYHHDLGDPLGKYSIKLREIDFIAENEDDDGPNVDSTLLELGDGQVMEIEP